MLCGVFTFNMGGDSLKQLNKISAGEKRFKALEKHQHGEPEKALFDSLFNGQQAYTNISRPLYVSRLYHKENAIANDIRHTTRKQNYKYYYV